MPGQKLEADQDPGPRRPNQLPGPDKFFRQQKDQGNPGEGADVGEMSPGQVEDDRPGGGQGQAPQGGREAAATGVTEPEESGESQQPEVDEKAGVEGGGEGEEEKDQVERIEEGGLRVGGEGDSAEDGRVPERDGPGAQGPEAEAAPVIIKRGDVPRLPGEDEGGEGGKDRLPEEEGDRPEQEQDRQPG